MLFSLLLSINQPAIGQTAPVARPLPLDEADTLAFSRNLDSLLELWYTKKYMDNSVISTSGPGPSVPHELSDSAYKARLDAINSYVPLTYNEIVKQQIQFYTKYRNGGASIMLGYVDYYFPVFEDVLDTYGVPTEIRCLPIIESALNPRAESWARAKGIWQFIFSTGKLYGLEINSYVDERMDPVKSSHAAARYLRDLYGIYGDWTLALAAYNCGPGNVQRAIKRSGGKRNYWEIYYYLPRETRGYVPAFIAATYLVHYHEDYGIYPASLPMPKAVDTVVVKEKVHLGQVAEVTGMPLQQLRDLNPQYIKDILPVREDKQYALVMPVQYISSFIELEDSIYNYKDTLFFEPGEKLKVPESASVNSYVPPAPEGKAKVAYTVKSGDALGLISDWFGVRTQDLRYWNNIHGNLIRVGQSLTIYVPEAQEGYYAKFNDMTYEQKMRMIGIEVNKKTEKKSPEKQENTWGGKKEYVYYTIKPGDNLWDISQKFDGVGPEDIMQINGFGHNHPLKPGDVIRIKEK